MIPNAEQLARGDVIAAVLDYLFVAGPRKKTELLAILIRRFNPPPPRGKGRKKGETKYDQMALLEKMLEVDLADPKQAGRALTALAKKLHNETPRQFGASEWASESGWRGCGRLPGISSGQT